MKCDALDDWKNRLGLFLGIALVFVFGCGPRVYGVNENEARELLVKVLDQWKAGASPDSFQAETPKIVVQDFEWKSGAKLISYEVTKDERRLDSNLVIQVKLNLTDTAGAEVSKTVGYVITTNPNRTVFRDIFH